MNDYFCTVLCFLSGFLLRTDQVKFSRMLTHLQSHPVFQLREFEGTIEFIRNVVAQVCNHSLHVCMSVLYALLRNWKCAIVYYTYVCKHMSFVLIHICTYMYHSDKTNNKIPL